MGMKMSVLKSYIDSDLFRKSSKILIEKLQSYGLKISNEHKECLDSLLRTFDASLKENLPPNYYLSSLPPGWGKTEAIASFIKAWKSCGFLPEGSVLIGLRTKDEIQSLVERLELDDADFACLTSDPKINALGCGDRQWHRARVLITTQEMVVRRTADRSFRSAKDFHYNGEVRSVRIWDESYLKAKQIRLTLSDIQLLPALLKRSLPDAADNVQGIIYRLIGATPGDVIQLPPKFDQTLKVIRAAIRDGKVTPSPKDWATVETLRQMGTRQATVMIERLSKDRVLVGASRPIPNDIAPLIITDASGTVRATYPYWQQASGDLVRLPSGGNDYRDVRFHIWPTPCGKDTLADVGKSWSIYRHVAETMATKPKERWLVISYKTGDRLDVESAVREATGEAIDFSYLNWGRHHGINDFKDIRNIVVIGSFFKDELDYVALASAAAPAAPMVPDRSVIPVMRVGEFKHDMLQAVMRGNARNSKDGVAGECTVYMIVSNLDDPAKLIGETFPGAVAERWSPVKRKPTGRAKEVIDFFEHHYPPGTPFRINKRAVYAILGMSKQHFGNLCRNSGHIKAYFRDNDICSDGIQHLARGPGS